MSSNPTIDDLIKNHTLCLICHHIQIIPDFVILDGGAILHRSCAISYLASNLRQNLFGSPRKHSHFDICQPSNDLYIWGLQFTTIYDIEIQELTIDDIKLFSPLRIINFALENSKIFSLLQPNLISHCITEVIKNNPSTNLPKHPLLASAIMNLTKEQIEIIPLQTILNFPSVFTNNIHIKQRLTSDLEKAISSSNDTIACAITSFEPNINNNTNFLTLCQKCPQYATRLLLDSTHNIYQMDEHKNNILINASLQLHKVPIPIIINIIKQLDPNLINHTNSSNASALTCAFTSHNIKALTTLLVDGVPYLDINHKNHHGHTVLSWAYFTKHYDIIALIFKTYYDNNNTIIDSLPHLFRQTLELQRSPTASLHLINTINFTPFSYITLMTQVCSYHPHPPSHLLHTLLRHALFNPNFPYYHNTHTLLSHAIIKGDLFIFKKMLFHRDTNPNFSTSSSFPLIFACTHNRLHMLKQLLDDERTDPNVTDDHNNTALHHAVDQNNGPIILALLSHPSINPYIKNKQGLTASQFAAIQNPPRISLFHHIMCANKLHPIFHKRKLLLTSALDHKSYELFVQYLRYSESEPELIIEIDVQQFLQPISIKLFDFGTMECCNIAMLKEFLTSPYLIVEQCSNIDLILEWAKRHNHDDIEEIIKKLILYNT